MLFRSVDVEAVEALLPQAPAQEDGLRYRALLRALTRLPEDHRAVLLLVGVEDLSYADAAKVLGVPVGTVMSRLSRARARLLQEIGDTPVERPVLRRVK